MVLKRFIKSWRGAVILVLLCLIGYMGLLVFFDLDTTIRLRDENDRYKQYFSEVEAWKQCVSEIEIRKIMPEGTEVIVFEDFKQCGERK